MRASEVIAATLSEAGVDTVFGVLGRSNLEIVDDLVRHHDTRYYAAAREDGAVAMADAYARVTGHLGVGTVGQGPGLTNAITSLEEAARARTPLLLVTGDAPAVSYQISALQDIDHRATISATGAGFQQARSLETLVADIESAIDRMLVERRPYLLNIPSDLQGQEADYRPRGSRQAAAELQRVPPDPAVLDRAVGLIASSKRPIVLAGHGAVRSGARDSLIRLADAVGAPLATTLLAKDLFVDHPFNIGLFGGLSSSLASEVIAASDCIVVFGASLNEWTTARGALVDGKRVVHCDIDCERFGRWVRPDVAVQGDADVVADTMASWISELELDPGSFRSPELGERLATFDPRGEFEDQTNRDTVDVRMACIELDRMLPQERLLVTDLGHFTMVPWQHVRVPHPRAFVSPHNFGSVGLCLASAVGAAVGSSDQLVVAVVGDGGLMMSLAEFNTACRYELPMAVVVIDDGAYGAEYHHFSSLKRATGLSLFEWPDFASVARVLGGDGVVVRSLDDLAAVKGYLPDLQRPLLIDIKVDPSVLVGHV